MMFASLAVAASSLALSANALLVAPSLEAIDGPITAAGAMGVDPLNQVVKLECKGCPFAKEVDGKKTWVEGVDNSLMIKFHVEHSSPEQLQINGVPIYPAKLHLPEPVFASQIESSVSEADFINSQSSEKKSSYSSVRLSYEAIVRDIKSRTSNTELIIVTFKITSLDGKHIEDKIEDVKATVIKTAEGKLLIVKVEKAESSDDGGHHHGHCRLRLLCKIKAALRHRLHGLKRVMHKCGHKLRMMRLHLIPIHRGHHHHHGHHGHHGHHEMAKPVAALPIPTAIEHATPTPTSKSVHLTEIVKDPKIVAKLHQALDEMRKNHYHPHRYEMARNGGKKHWIQTVRRVAFQIFIPVLVGVAAGMTASLLGMVVGQLVVMLWRRYRRSNKKYDSVAREEGSEVDAESVVSSEEGLEEKPFLDEKH